MKTANTDTTDHTADGCGYEWCEAHRLCDCAYSSTAPHRRAGCKYARDNDEDAR